jgi:hypothetical protein
MDCFLRRSDYTDGGKVVNGRNACTLLAGSRLLIQSNRERFRNSYFRTVFIRISLGLSRTINCTECIKLKKTN